LVDEAGKQLGVMPTRQALELAEERGLDLVEVAPAAAPPVCRLLDYGKFRYEATRKEKEARRDNKARSTNELREVRFKTRIGEHDRAAKTRLVRRLLDTGAKVKVSVMFRGREITHPEVGMAVLKLVAEDLADDAMMEKRPSFEGRFLSMILSPPSASAKARAIKQGQAAPEKEAVKVAQA
jgi:translation initiation factor IF-3